MNKFLKYFLILLALVLIVVPIVFATLLLKRLKMHLNLLKIVKMLIVNQIYETIKVNPEEQPISILFLGIDDNDGRRKKAKMLNTLDQTL